MVYSLRRSAELAVALLSEPGFLPAAVRWPTFSLTSFLMVSRLAKLGIMPSTVVDVGANVGQFAVAIAKIFPQAAVHSYEPVPESYAKLLELASRLPNLKVCQLALGETEGELAFHVNSHTHSSSALPLAEIHKSAFPSAREVKGITVKAATLDCVYNQVALAPPVFLKLDVQGYEEQVLKGGLRFLDQVDYVLAELSFEPLYLGEKSAQAMVTFMGDLGFEFIQPVGFLEDPRNGKYLQIDALFASRKISRDGRPGCATL